MKTLEELRQKAEVEQTNRETFEKVAREIQEGLSEYVKTIVFPESFAETLNTWCDSKKIPFFIVCTDHGRTWATYCKSYSELFDYEAQR